MSFLIRPWHPTRVLVKNVKEYTFCLPVNHGNRMQWSSERCRWRRNGICWPTLGINIFVSFIGTCACAACSTAWKRLQIIHVYTVWFLLWDHGAKGVKLSVWPHLIKVTRKASLATRQSLSVLDCICKCLISARECMKTCQFQDSRRQIGACFSITMFPFCDSDGWTWLVSMTTDLL